MRYLTIDDGSEVMNISKLMLGSIYFGTEISDSESFFMMDSFLNAGGTMIDTARCYANWLPEGEGASENAIGRWLSKGKKRNRVLIGTKGGNTKKGENPYRADLTKTGLTKELEMSLRCLQTDYVDMYWLHRDDPRIQVEEIVELTNEFVKQGKARMIGVSNWSIERLYEANQYAKAHKLRPFAMNQVQFSLAETTGERCGDTTIVCMDRKKECWYISQQMPIAAFTAQGQGFYTKIIQSGVTGISDDLRWKFYYGENINRIERIKKIEEETGYTPTQIVLGYLECNEVANTALIGSRTRQQLEDSLTATDVIMSQNQIQYLRDGTA